jgi:hypothetical protein
METKPFDKRYCNVNAEKIKNANPILNQTNLKHFYDWISERYTIHIKKDILKQKAPWTNNKVLLNYRFTNVRREHDKESKWLIENISNNNNLSYENKILNSILFRLINKSQTVEIFKTIDFNNLNISSIKKQIIEFDNKNKKYVYFSNAFYTSGPKATANKIFGKNGNVINMIMLVENYKNKNIIEKIKSSKDQKQVFDTLNKCPGLGKFLAYQIYVDLTYIKEFPFSENEFVVAGPGCIKGLKFLFKDFDILSPEESVFWIRDNQNKIFDKFGYNPKQLFSDLPEKERYLNIMSIQNCFCELSKYIRAIEGTGRPRARYKE